MAEQFLLSDAQWAAIEPLLPQGGKLQGPASISCRAALRAIPAEYGPRTTLFNRFNRWSQRGLWQELMAALTAVAEPPEIAMVDSTSVRAHRSADANEQSHAALLRGEDVLDPSPDARSRGVAARDVRRHRPSVGLGALELRSDRVARPFGFALTNPGGRLSRTRLFSEVTRIEPLVGSRGE